MAPWESVAAVHKPPGENAGMCDKWRRWESRDDHSGRDMPCRYGWPHARGSDEVAINGDRAIV